MFIDTFRIQKCLETVKRQNLLKYSKNLVKSPVSGHFPYSKVPRNSKTTILPVSRHCLLGKVGRLEGLKVGRLEGWKIGRFK